MRNSSFSLFNLGQKAFLGYFGDRDQDSWKAHDATELVREHRGKLNVLIDVGTNDKFYKQGQLLPENFDYAVEEAGAKGEGYRLRYQEVSGEVGGML